MSSTTEVAQAPPADHLEPADENAAALEAIQAEAKRAGLARLPRRGESRDAYLLAVGRHKGVLPPDAHITDVASAVKTMLSRAADDELYGNSPAGKALIAAAAIWPRMNPEIELVGELMWQSRRGVRVPVAHLVQELQRDPARRLSLPEAQLLTLYAGDDLVAAVQALRPAIDAAYARVREAAEVELQRPHYDGMLPEPPKPERAPEAVPLGLGTSRSSLAPVLTAADLKGRGF